jgi:serine/threonine kinase 38
MDPRGGTNPKANPVAHQGQADYSNNANHNAGAQNQYAQKREMMVSQTSKDKAEAFRSYIERKYSKRKVEEKEKKENWDMIQKKMDDLKISVPEQELIKREILHKEAEHMRDKRKKISARDFEPIAIIGRGAFGEVRVCRWKDTAEVVAMKKMNKSEMVYKNQVPHILAEKNVLSSAAGPWIVELKCSFQDDKYLYLVMEYLAGGDLMTLLMKKDILAEDEAKMYIAETILAVEAVHKLNYIHRDLKPDNILLDHKGHIKLSDFGLCKHTEIRPRKFEFKKMDEPPQDPVLTKSNLSKKQTGYRRNRQLAYSTVGTPDYIAPEVFGQNGYTETVDWWSVGVILFEMLVGYPPFFSEDPSLTCQKILHWRKTLVIPSEANLSNAAIDLLKRLITDSNERLGINGVEEIKAHPFFAGVDWKRIRDKKSPNIPELKSEIDTSNFDKFDEEEPWYIEDQNKSRKQRKDINFIGYTFKRDIEAQRSLLVVALQELERNKASQARAKTAALNAKKEEAQNNANAISQKMIDTNVSVVNNGQNNDQKPHYPAQNQQISTSNIASALGTISQMNQTSHNNYFSNNTKQQQQQQQSDNVSNNINNRESNISKNENTRYEPSNPQPTRNYQVNLPGYMHHAGNPTNPYADHGGNHNNGSSKSPTHAQVVRQVQPHPPQQQLQPQQPAPLNSKENLAYRTNQMNRPDLTYMHHDHANLMRKKDNFGSPEVNLTKTKVPPQSTQPSTKVFNPNANYANIPQLHNKAGMMESSSTSNLTKASNYSNISSKPSTATGQQRMKPM